MPNNTGATIFQILVHSLAMSFLLFSPEAMASQTNWQSMGKTNSMGVATDTASRAVPPIDRVASATYKTVTFGLG